MMNVLLLLLRSIVLMTALFVAGCGGGGGGASAPAPAAFAGASAVSLGAQPVTVALPLSGGITGTMTFPAVSAGAVLQVSTSASPPAGVTPQARSRVQATATGTLSVYEYVTIIPATTVVLPSIPAFTLLMPAQIPTAGKSFFYAISTPDGSNPPTTFGAHGPATLDGQTVAFAAAATPLSLVAGQRYVFMVYATYAAAASSGPHLYVAGPDNRMRVFNSDGTPAFTFDIGIGEFTGVAIDATGKIYITDSSTGSVATYTPQGKRTTPTITGLSRPSGIAVGPTGKIYVANECCGSPNSTGAITSYLPDGTPATPTITTGLNGPKAITVDRSGKIYVVNGCCENFDHPSQSTWGVRTYTADGQQTTPTIVAGPTTFPSSVAVDANGKIYVANEDEGPNVFAVTTFAPNGTPTTPTIKTPMNSPGQVAVDTFGKIYVSLRSTVATYLPDGSPTVPTFVFAPNLGLGPIAVH